MEEGQIILAVFETDKERKNRPALILRKSPKYNDYLLCGITSKLHEEIKDFDFLIDKNHADFPESGLKNDGLIRLFFLGIVREEEILGTIGSISNSTLLILQKRLADYILHQ
jgi:mRNA interferase MazF